MKFETVTMDPEFRFWVIAEYEPGKRVTKDMVTFDTTRQDVHVNKYGVVHFRDIKTARMLLSIDFRMEK